MPYPLGHWGWWITWRSMCYAFTRPLLPVYFWYTICFTRRCAIALLFSCSVWQLACMWYGETVDATIRISDSLADIRTESLGKFVCESSAPSAVPSLGNISWDAPPIHWLRSRPSPPPDNVVFDLVVFVVAERLASVHFKVGVFCDSFPLKLHAISKFYMLFARFPLSFICFHEHFVYIFNFDFIFLQKYQSFMTNTLRGKQDNLSWFWVSYSFVLKHFHHTLTRVKSKTNKLGTQLHEEDATVFETQKNNFSTPIERVQDKAKRPLPLSSEPTDFPNNLSRVNSISFSDFALALRYVSDYFGLSFWSQSHNSCVLSFFAFKIVLFSVLICYRSSCFLSTKRRFGFGYKSIVSNGTVHINGNSNRNIDCTDCNISNNIGIDDML